MIVEVVLFGHWTPVTGNTAVCPDTARESWGWICHRWKGGERQAVARCTEQRSPGKMRFCAGEPL